MSVERKDPGTVELVAVGDVCMGDSPEGVGGGVHAEFERVGRANPAYPLEHVKPIFEGADVVFGNLEVVLSHMDLVRWKLSSMEMRGHPDAAQRLVDAGFTVLNVANNHSMQHNIGPFTDTVDRLKGLGLGVVGVATADHRGCVPHVFTVNGLRITMLGYAFEPDVYVKGPVGYAFAPNCDVLAQVAEAKAQSDIVMVSLHWGVEFVAHPSVEEEAFGRRLVDAGADLVIGHHPHVIRRVERYGRGLIAYSLGNFVFDMLWNPAFRTGLVVRVKLSKNGVESYDTELVWIGDDYQPRRMSEAQHAEAAGAFHALHQRPDWVSAPEQYDRALQEWIARSRYESWAHFLRTANRRPVNLTLQTMWRTARRKAAGVLGYE
jgi:poly-gamma-glutamate synthesis protein (capsule biosynthesis protein)